MIKVDEKEKLGKMAEHNLEPRVSALEVGLRSLAEDVQDLANIIREQNRDLTESINSSHKDLTISIKSVSDKLTETFRPQWATMIAGVGLIVVLIGAVLSPVWLSLTDVDKDLMQVLERQSVVRQQILKEATEIAHIQSKVDNLEMGILQIHKSVLRDIEQETKINDTKVEYLEKQILLLRERIHEHEVSGNNHPSGVIGLINKLEGELSIIKSLMAQNKIITEK